MINYRYNPFMVKSNGWFHPQIIYTEVSNQQGDEGSCSTFHTFQNGNGVHVYARREEEHHVLQKYLLPLSMIWCISGS